MITSPPQFYQNEKQPSILTTPILLSPAPHIRVTNFSEKECLKIALMRGYGNMHIMTSSSKLLSFKVSAD